MELLFLIALTSFRELSQYNHPVENFIPFDSQGFYTFYAVMCDLPEGGVTSFDVRNSSVVLCFILLHLA